MCSGCKLVSHANEKPLADLVRLEVLLDMQLIVLKLLFSKNGHIYLSIFTNDNIIFITVDCLINKMMDIMT